MHSHQLVARILLVLGSATAVGACVAEGQPERGDGDTDTDTDTDTHTDTDTRLEVGSLVAPATTVDVGKFTVTVAAAGDGGGVVTSLDQRLKCGPACQAEFAGGEVVTLEAFPDEGTTFRGWLGADCLGEQPCAVKVDRSRTVTAYFTSDVPGSIQGQP